MAVLRLTVLLHPRLLLLPIPLCAVTAALLLTYVCDTRGEGL